MCELYDMFSLSVLHGIEYQILKRYMSLLWSTELKGSIVAQKSNSQPFGGCSPPVVQPCDRNPCGLSPLVSNLSLHLPLTLSQMYHVLFFPGQTQIKQKCPFSQASEYSG
jgi:hypothetical protein